MGSICRYVPISIFLIQMFYSTHAVKFPNDIDGQPEVECGDSTVKINVKTSNGLASRIYAKGHYSERTCNFEKTNSGSFNIGTCGMNRQRQLEPRGVSYSLVVVVQLHPMFVTKVDRAYSVKCFYMEAEKTVTSFLDVSMISTQAVTGGAPMPICNYELHSDSPNGAGVRYARVGDKVWHTWTCPSSTYGILVHSCVVTDGQGNDFRVIDERGCGLDQYVFRTPEYSDDLTRVQQETHVFKFADKTAVMFNCQIKLCQKADNGCDGVSPPVCSSSPTGPSEQIISELLTTTTGQTTASNVTSIFNLEPSPFTAVAIKTAAPLETKATASNTAANEDASSTSGRFPTPSTFFELESLNSSIAQANLTMSNAGNSSIIFISSANSSSYLETYGFESANYSELDGDSFTVATANGSDTAVLEALEASTRENFTLFSNWIDYSVHDIQNGTDVVNISSDGDEITNSSSLNASIAEGVVAFSKSGNPNLTGLSETEDTLRQISMDIDLSQSNNESSKFDLDDPENDTDSWNLGASAKEQWDLANATVIVLGGEEGRERRSALKPSLKRTVDSVNDLIARGNQATMDEPMDQAPDIETDVSQMMWVLEPEEGRLRDGHRSEADFRTRENDLRSLNLIEEGDDDSLQISAGRVCLSKRTMVAMLLPLTAIALMSLVAMLFFIRRRRSESKFMHARQSFPLNYLYKPSH